MNAYAGISPNLSLKDSGCGTGALREWTGTLLEQIEGVEDWRGVKLEKFEKRSSLTFKRDNYDFFATIPTPLLELTQSVDQDTGI